MGEAKLRKALGIPGSDAFSPTPNWMLGELITMLKPVADAKEKPEDATLSILMDNHEAIQLFDFGDLDAVPMEEFLGLDHYGIELINHSLWKLPYDFVAYLHPR